MAGDLVVCAWAFRCRCLGVLVLFVMVAVEVGFDFVGPLQRFEAVALVLEPVQPVVAVLAVVLFVVLVVAVAVAVVEAEVVSVAVAVVVVVVGVVIGSLWLVQVVFPSWVVVVVLLCRLVCH